MLKLRLAVGRARGTSEHSCSRHSWTTSQTPSRRATASKASTNRPIHSHPASLYVRIYSACLDWILWSTWSTLKMWIKSSHNTCMASILWTPMSKRCSALFPRPRVAKYLRSGSGPVSDSYLKWKTSHWISRIKTRPWCCSTGAVVCLSMKKNTIHKTMLTKSTGTSSGCTNVNL